MRRGDPCLPTFKSTSVKEHSAIAPENGHNQEQSNQTFDFSKQHFYFLVFLPKSSNEISYSCYTGKHDWQHG